MILDLLRSLGILKPKPFSLEITEEQRQAFERRMKDPGIFTYDEDGFEVHFDKNPVKVQWSEIDRLVGYKMDRYTIDLVCLTVEYGDLYITLHEELDGWYVFLDKCRALFPDVPKDWEVTITFPAFARNETVLYARGK
jgi:hypothetical protein